MFHKYATINSTKFATTGLFFILPCTDDFIKLDLRTVSFDVPPQEVSLILGFY